MLCNLIQCPHRAAMDLFGDATKRDEPSKLVQLLWERGTAYEKEVIEGLKFPVSDLSAEARERDRDRTGRRFDLPSEDTVRRLARRAGLAP